jgi:hypothetical protein
MKTLTKMLIAATAVAGVAGLAIPAAADVVCNGDNECWHTHRHYDYRPEFGVTVHPDNWAWGANDHYRWHEHNGRGYWHSGVWVTF